MFGLINSSKQIINPDSVKLFMKVKTTIKENIIFEKRDTSYWVKSAICIKGQSVKCHPKAIQTMYYFSFWYDPIYFIKIEIFYNNKKMQIEYYFNIDAGVNKSNYESAVPNHIYHFFPETYGYDPSQTTEDILTFRPNAKYIFKFAEHDKNEWKESIEKLE